MEARRMKVSHTRMSMLERCGQQFLHRYIMGERRPPGVALIVGKSVDGAINADLDSKMLSGSLLLTEEVEDCARDLCEHAWDEEPEVVFDPGISRDEAKGRSVDTSVILASTYHNRVAPAVEPTHIQQGFLLDIPDYDAEVEGWIDVRERGVVTDNKTASKKPSAPPVEQLELYSLAVSRLDGERPTTLRADYLVSTKKPQAVRMEWEPGVDTERRVLSRIESFVDSVQKEAWVPANPDTSWWCSERWCGWHSVCPYARRPMSVTVKSMGGDE